MLLIIIIITIIIMSQTFRFHHLILRNVVALPFLLSLAKAEAAANAGVPDTAAGADVLDTPASTAAKCYSLPYGALGFISHLLTFYSVAMIYIFRRQPLLFWKRIKDQNSNGWNWKNCSKSIFWCFWWDKIIGVLVVVTTCISTTSTLSKCQGQDSQWDTL